MKGKKDSILPSSLTFHFVALCERTASNSRRRNRPTERDCEKENGKKNLRSLARSFKAFFEMVGGDARATTEASLLRSSIADGAAVAI